MSELLDQINVEETGSLARLRGFVLDLAVRGRLLPQLSAEGSGSSLVAGLRGVDRKRDPANEQEPPFDLPASWTWSTVGSVSSYVQRGKGPDYVEASAVPVVSQKSVQWEGFLIERARFIDPKSLSAYGEERLLRDGDLLWNSTGHGTVGRVAVFRSDPRYPRVVADSHVTIVRPEIEPRFLWCWLASPTVQRTIDDLVSGTTKQTELSTSTVVAHPVPVPPLAEQKRIVAKVDQLMALCDDLEARQTKKRDTSTRLTKAALQALTTAEGPEEFDLAWKRVVENFDVLIDRAEKVGELRQAVVDLAVGAWAGRPGTSVSHALLSEVVLETRYGTARKCGKDAALTPVLRIPNVVRGTLDLSDLKYTTLPDDELAELRLQSGDILVVRSNGSRDLVGRATVVDRRAEGFAFAGYLIRLRVRHGAILPEWLRLAMDSSPVRRAVEGPARTTSGVHNINTREILSLSVPVPPLSSQRAILDRVAALMKVCDDLEARLARAEGRASKLVEAVVQDLVA